MTGTRAHDFDLHGMVGLRLIDAGPRELAAVRAQLGPIDGSPAGGPDIVIRFVDRLPHRSPLRLLGAREAGFTDDAFFVLRSRHGAPAMVELPLDEVGAPRGAGGPLEIRCERGLPAVPLLIPILNLTVLAKGGLPLHASAFRYRGRGVLAPGWAKGGKTELLLAFAAEGAQYIGDEWVYLDRGGDRMSGIPEPIRLWDRHLEDLPGVRRRLGARRRARLASLRHASLWMARLGGDGRAGASSVREGARRIAGALGRQRWVRLPPRELFAGANGANGAMRCPLDTVVFVASHDDPRTVVDTISPAEVADRMTASLQEERSDLVSWYRHFRFAFPHRPNALIESAEAIERERLHDFLHGRTCHAVHHPYPPSLPDLLAAVRPVVTDGFGAGAERRPRSKWPVGAGP